MPCAHSSLIGGEMFLLERSSAACLLLDRTPIAPAVMTTIRRQSWRNRWPANALLR